MSSPSPMSKIIQGTKGFRVYQQNLHRNTFTGRIQFINLNQQFNKDFAIVFFVKNLANINSLSSELISSLSYYLDNVLDQDKCVRVKTMGDKISILSPLFGIVDIDNSDGIDIFKIMNNCSDYCSENSVQNSEYNKIDFVPQIKLFSREGTDETICVRGNWTADKCWMIYGNMDFVLGKILRVIYDRVLPTSIFVVDKETLQ